MDDIEIMKARLGDAQNLAAVSRRAFHSDALCGGAGQGGPPGYDSPQWQRRMMGRSEYYKVLLDKKIVGGAIVFRKGREECCLGRMFIDPDCHRKGIGTQVVHRLLAMYPGVKKWTLETPPWNTRTRSFYLKLGFRIVGQTAGDVFFEKKL